MFGQPLSALFFPSFDDDISINWNNSRITLLQALWLVICTLLDWSPQLDSKIKSFMNNKTTSVC
jgi:hypothetical protein